MQISRIRLSDQTSHLHPRHVVPKPGQAYEPEVPVKVREWIAPALAPPDLVLGAHPPAQPHSCVVVERPVRFVDGPYSEVVRPSAGAGRFSVPTGSVVSCQVPFRSVSTWIFSTMRSMLFFDGRYTEGFGHFVTSMTAPVASGWSDRRVGLAPTGKAPPYHRAHPTRTLRAMRFAGVRHAEIQELAYCR